MSRPRNGFRLLGLCALALGVMAIGAGAAQAEVGSHWNVNGAAISSPLLPQVDATLENSHGILLSKALGATLNILCTGIKLEEFFLHTEGKSSGKIKYTGCEIYLNGVLSAPCLPHVGPENDVILTKPLKDLIVLHEGQPVDRLEPVVPPIFALIETGPECAVGSSINVIGGKLTVKDCKNQGSVELVTHLVEELAALTELWIISKTVEHKATLDGSANVFLIGAHTGLKWSATPA